ncbi:MAG TPA: NYN domain-containing protein [Flavilitoribacter sp.]|nr:NYN domain-containing protein [Lewinella sp.]MCB9278559.1 NYN domain-containing protein [Lewinellaceae bacterium]HMQ60474.1 NYN domain-containing protein [Flavilitoribacter sp.]
MREKMTRIGVFYDGNYFLHVSNYYNYDHQRRRRLSISGLHEFIRHQVAQEENVDVRLAQIVSAHYFRGRLNAFEAKQRGDTLYWDRVFDDILMSAGVMTHFLPLRSTFGRREEKGVDVYLALEAYDQGVHDKFDVLVLISSDGDYVPLIRKLNGAGVRVMVLSWDFEYENEIGKRMITRTSQELLEEVTYPIAMHELIDNRLKRNDPLVNNIFVQTEGKKAYQVEPATNGHEAFEEFEEGEILVGEIFSLKNGYGFIKYPPNNLFFHHTSVIDGDFTELREGDEVEFTIGRNDDGEPIAESIRLLWEEE